MRESKTIPNAGGIFRGRRSSFDKFGSTNMFEL